VGLSLWLITFCVAGIKKNESQMALVQHEDELNIFNILGELSLPIIKSAIMA